jgi:hypothetical protein
MRVSWKYQPFVCELKRLGLIDNLILYLLEAHSLCLSQKQCVLVTIDVDSMSYRLRHLDEFVQLIRLITSIVLNPAYSC